MNKRAGNRTEKQIELLVEFIEENPELKSGKFTPTFTYKTCQKLWMNFAEKANALGSSKKDWKQWRKTWQDMRSKTKMKKSAERMHMTATGGGTPIVTNFTPIEERIVSLIGTVPIDGHPNSRETLVNFNFPDTQSQQPNNTSQPSTSAEYANMNNPAHFLDVTFEESILEVGDTVTIDHTYTNKNKENLEPETPPLNVVLNTPKASCKGRLLKSKRLEKSINATERLADQTERKIRMKENYYREKLAILREDSTQRKRIADALEALRQN